ncbi:YdeI/OmpD-associated family protein [Cellulomonas alba]|uniref:YdeI/OmpD-associated family protein n=1 Tax=Cellulomonas alba TaxID=3053467 RepID=A0ABT7SGB0_9CELL|nr:YdeI/OmpD-associated family protein [Cellulomonas alba]MDM7855210.1 YdeI/OmpD-associated family protein [Cellulomonas alba]
MRTDAPQVAVESAAQWRAWLAEHHDDPEPGVWVVLWRATSGRPVVTYEQLIEEGVAYGWVDSQSASLDAERSMLWFTRRRPGSPWSGTNKARAARVDAAGRLAAPGRAAIEAAKADGSWTVLDDVENLVVPADLAAALAARPGARECWDAFRPAARRTILRWLLEARRPATRAARIDETARLAEQGVPAHQQPR